MKKKEFLNFYHEKRNSNKKLKGNTLSNSSDTYKRAYNFDFEKNFQEVYYPDIKEEKKKKRKN